ncbi:hypothetical protein TNCT_494641 [Trichonephila clavata]|uniref:Uncharacterized protein n=1 Tax=Trichonephila clavata TaxID=2740835 RepID=A0A8X6HR63_TRICU|nr:hypothetical protein TNCT_494641 [Trichonephila clavata]
MNVSVIISQISVYHLIPCHIIINLCLNVIIHHQLLNQQSPQIYNWADYHVSEYRPSFCPTDNQLNQCALNNSLLQAVSGFKYFPHRFEPSGW